MLADKWTELSRIKLKNLNLTASPNDQRAFSPLGPTVSWLSHLALAIYIFVVVNFDALAQASDIQIERRQFVFFCWKQDLNTGSQTPNRQQTECSLTNRLSVKADVIRSPGSTLVWRTEDWRKGYNGGQWMTGPVQTVDREPKRKVLLTGSWRPGPGWRGEGGRRESGA